MTSININYHRVLHIISSPAAGGAEIYVKDLCIEAKRTGANVRIIFISSAVEHGRSYEFQEFFLKELDKHGIEYKILPSGSDRNIFAGILPFLKVIKSFKPTIVHSHLLSGLIYSFLAKLFGSYKICHTHHNSRVKSNQYVFRLLMRIPDLHIGISQICCHALDKYLGKKNRSHLIYNGVSTSRLTRSNDFHYSKDDKVLICAVGRMYEQKNYPFMIEVFHRLNQNSGLNTQLLIAGDGPVRSTIEELIKHYELSDKVTLLGDFSEVPSLLCLTDIFIMSSNWEGLPISLIEAQMCGVPALVTDVGGCSEIINLTHGGCLVEKGDIVSFSNKLLELINNNKLRNDLGVKASSAKNYFSISNSSNAHFEAYNSLFL